MLRHLTPRSRLPQRPRPRPVPLAIRMRLALARRRRVVVALLVALAVGSAVHALRPPPPRTTQVLVAAHDLPAGRRLLATDLAPRDWPAGATPGGLLTRPLGRVLAAPVRRGEPVTDVRVTPTGKPGSAGVPAGWVAVTVRLTDPAGSLLVAPGDRVEVLAGATTDPLGGGGTAEPSGPAPAQVVVHEAMVLTTPTDVSSTTTTRQRDTEGVGDHPTPAQGLLGAFGSGERSTSHGQGRPTTTLPDGVLVLAVSPQAALDLAAVNGVRTLTVARRL